MKVLYQIWLFSLKNVLKSYQKELFKSFEKLLFIIVAIIGVYLGILEGLKFIVSLGSLGTVIIKKLIFILFFMLFFMIATSFCVIFYRVGFRSKETDFLISLPILEEELIFYKFLESTFLSSWMPSLGLLLFFIAYCKVSKVSSLVSIFSVFYIIPFMVISCFLGFLLTLFFIRYVNFKKLFLFFVFFLIVLTIKYYSPFRMPKEDILFYLSEDIIFFKISKLWFLPFSWPGYGLTYLENQDLIKSLIYLSNLWSLMLVCLSYVCSFKNVFMHIYYQKSSLTHKTRRDKDYIRWIFYKASFLPNYMNAFVIKDIKLFLRESSIWLQFLIFFGILFFYFLNLRKFSYHLLDNVWKNLLSFLNTFSILCIVSAMSTRFVFPQWSLEGKNFWTLKLAPLSLKKIFIEKFILSFGILSLISELLIFTSNYMLGVEKLFFKLTMFIIFVATSTMINISLGLGAYFADFTQEYYLNALENIGGFITLLINFGYMFLTVFLFASISHLHFIGKLTNFSGILKISLTVWSIFSLGISLVFSWIGLKNLENKEF